MGGRASAECWSRRRVWGSRTGVRLFLRNPLYEYYSLLPVRDAVLARPGRVRRCWRLSFARETGG